MKFFFSASVALGLGKVPDVYEFTWYPTKDRKGNSGFFKLYFGAIETTFRNGRLRIIHRNTNFLRAKADFVIFVTTCFFRRVEPTQVFYLGTS